MSRQRKVHRFGFLDQGFDGRRGRQLAPSYSRIRNARLTTKAACGVMLYPGTPDCGFGVVDLVFNSFPTERRCWTCESKHRHLTAPREQALLWIATVEVLCLELSLLGAAAQAVPHSERGCYFRFETGVAGGMCWCGRLSKLHVPDQMILAKGALEEALELFGIGDPDSILAAGIQSILAVRDMLEEFNDSERYHGGEPIGYPARWNGVEG